MGQKCLNLQADELQKEMHVSFAIEVFKNLTIFNSKTFFIVILDVGTK